MISSGKSTFCFVYVHFSLLVTGSARPSLQRAPGTGGRVPYLFGVQQGYQPSSSSNRRNSPSCCEKSKRIRRRTAALLVGRVPSGRDAAAAGSTGRADAGELLCSCGEAIRHNNPSQAQQRARGKASMHGWRCTHEVQTVTLVLMLTNPAASIAAQRRFLTQIMKSTGL